MHFSTSHSINVGDSINIDIRKARPHVTVTTMHFVDSYFQYYKGRLPKSASNEKLAESAEQLQHKLAIHERSTYQITDRRR
jgi:hypothetical protein